MKKIFLSIILLLSVLSIFAQDAKEKDSRKTNRNEKRKERRERINERIRLEEEGALVFHKQTTFGFKLNTDGYSFFFEKATMQSARVANFYTIEVGEKKHPQENKITGSFTIAGPFAFANNPFVYGKRNIFYQAKLGFGQQRVIGYRGNKNGVSVTGVYGGGFSAGLLRPYYVRVQRSLNDEIADIKYSPSDSLDFLGGRIIEGTGLKHGWNELKFTPGVHSRMGLRFDYGRFNETVSAIEVGINAEYYFTKPEILLLAKNKNFFFSAYVSINFGKRK
ncbi:MAG TPA: hypothetical protein VFN30_08170 [Chitinophagaceae bacterium]|nr:hypothetical protein [Chitinophagaceae bacterium]